MITEEQQVVDRLLFNKSDRVGGFSVVSPQVPQQQVSANRRGRS